MDVIVTLRVELREPLRQRAQRQQGDAVNVRYLVLVWFPDIDDVDAPLGVFQRAFHFLDGYFVGTHGWVGGLRGYSTKQVVVDEFLNRGVIATDRAFGVAPQLQFTKLHVKRVEQQEAAG